MKYFNQLNKIISRKQKLAFISLTILMLITVFLEILTLNSIFILLSFFTSPESLEHNRLILMLKNIDLVIFSESKFLVLFFIIFFSKTIFSIFIIYKEHAFINNTRAEISNDFFRGYLYMPRIFHLRTNISETTKNITTEIDVLISALLSISVITLESLVLIGLVIFLLFVNYKITIISFMCLLIFSILLSFLNAKKIITLGKKRVKLIQKRLKNIIEGLSGAKIYTLTGSQENLINNFNSNNYSLASNNINIGFRNGIPRPLFELFILTIVVVFLIFFLKNNSILIDIIPTLGVFLTAAYRLVPSFGKILTNIQKFQYNIAAAQKLSIDKERFVSLEEENKKIIPIEFENHIEIKNLNFSYDKNFKNDKNFVLKDVNLKFKKGSKIGIVGKSGCGKSTLVDLLMGISSPQSGKIFIDGKNLENFKKNWHKVIGCVPQDVFILDESLKKNIAFGLPDEDINDEKLEKAIYLSNLSELKNSLKHGVDTLVGEKGSRLSGGQRQRIGIARALYHNPKVLFFDEATNALDIETEKKIIKEIFINQKNKTIFFVSHNLENLRYCDEIYEVVDKTTKQFSKGSY